jgi:hypothetical protein
MREMGKAEDSFWLCLLSPFSCRFHHIKQNFYFRESTSRSFSFFERWSNLSWDWIALPILDGVFVVVLVFRILSHVFTFLNFFSCLFVQFLRNLSILSPQCAGWIIRGFPIIKNYCTLQWIVYIKSHTLTDISSNSIWNFYIEPVADILTAYRLHLVTIFLHLTSNLLADSLGVRIY